ncbi:MAG: DUF2490 domain-containing protein [Acidobacteria bacterium]|nr:DUF2490 domain-containing protein [Acidobacteriota bacterium]
MLEEIGILCFKRPFLLIVLMLSIGLAQKPLRAEDLPDLQLWSEFQVAHSLSERVEWSALISPRFSSDISRFSTLKLATVAGIALNGHLEVAPFVYYYVRHPAPGRTTRETRWGSDAAVSVEKSGWKFQERNRVDLRDIDHDWSWRYRQMFRLSHRSPWRNVNLHASYEFFYDSQVTRWRQNRLLLGGTFRLKHSSMELYFMSNDSHVSPKEDFNVIGTSVRFIF